MTQIPAFDSRRSPHRDRFAQIVKHSVGEQAQLIGRKPQSTIREVATMAKTVLFTLCTGRGIQSASFQERSVPRLRVPKDCSVIGFDDISAAAICTPGLTTIHQPIVKMGEYATHCVLERLEEGEGSENQVFNASNTMPAEIVGRVPTAKRKNDRSFENDLGTILNHA
jgi:hypothetical protein